MSVVPPEFGIAPALLFPDNGGMPLRLSAMSATLLRDDFPADATETYTNRFLSLLTSGGYCFPSSQFQYVTLLSIVYPHLIVKVS